MTFYKYAAESGIKILENLKLKVSPPNEFNDPFELTPKSKFTLTLDGMLNEMKANPDSYRDVHAAMKKDGLTHTFEEFIKILPAMHSHSAAVAHQTAKLVDFAFRRALVSGLIH